MPTGCKLAASPTFKPLIEYRSEESWAISLIRRCVRSCYLERGTILGNYKVVYLALILHPLWDFSLRCIITHSVWWWSPLHTEEIMLLRKENAHSIRLTGSDLPVLFLEEHSLFNGSVFSGGSSLDWSFFSFPAQAPMALFYPATFGIVGQKMTTLQHRSQGDPEDPHDEQYLLATQSKQEQVCSNSGWEEIVLCLREVCPHFMDRCNDSMLKLILLLGP